RSTRTPDSLARRFRDKPANPLRDLFGAVPGHPVLGAADDLQLRAGDRLVETPGVHERKMLVALGPEDQRRARDLAIELGQLCKRTLVAGTELGDESPDLGSAEALPQVGAERLGKVHAARQERLQRAPEHQAWQVTEDPAVPAEAAQHADLPRGRLVAE